MKNRAFAFAMIFVTIVAYTSCTKPASQLALYVPKDATAVFTIDTKALTDKIASSGITIDSLASLFKEEEGENGLQWNDIRNSGIDLDKSIYIYSKQTSSVQLGNIQSGALVAEVQDANKLEAFFKKQTSNNVLSADKYKYISLDNESAAGWTDRIVIISTTKTSSTPGEKISAQQQLTTLFTQKESASIASLDEFGNMLAKPGDIHFYINTASGLNTTAVTGMTNLNALVQDSYTEGVINFEKGKIAATTESHYNKTLSGILTKYPSKNIDKDIIKNYPGALAGFGIISFDPKVLVDILHYVGFDVMADGFASGMGFTTSDVVNAFSGDIAIMYSPRSKTTGGQQQSGESGFLLNLAIGDKTAFDKVITGLLNKEILTKHGDEYQLGLAGGHGFVIENDNASLFISSSDELIKAYQAPGNKAALPADIEKKISDKTMALYVDINQLLQNKTTKDSSADIHLRDSYYVFNVSKAAKETFKNIIATTDKGDGKTVKGNFELNFVNTNENSLASLTKFMAIARKEKLREKNGWTDEPSLHKEDSLAENKIE
ncbi:MAG TPA: DUF4836 family protein [Parafilimonas sp.]|nr:DUF4836 family protein [Parafilimonas sp.]